MKRILNRHMVVRLSVVGLLISALLPISASAGPAQMTVSCSYSTVSDYISLSVQNAPGGTDYVRYVVEIRNNYSSSSTYQEPYGYLKPDFSAYISFPSLEDSQIYPLSFQAYAVGKNGLNKKGMPKIGGCIQLSQ